MNQDTTDPKIKLYGGKGAYPVFDLFDIHLVKGNKTYAKRFGYVVNCPFQYINKVYQSSEALKKIRTVQPSNATVGSQIVYGRDDIRYIFKFHFKGCNSGATEPNHIEKMELTDASKAPLTGDAAQHIQL